MFARAVVLENVGRDFISGGSWKNGCHHLGIGRWQWCVAVGGGGGQWAAVGGGSGWWW